MSFSGLTKERRKRLADHCSRAWNTAINAGEGAIVIDKSPMPFDNLLLAIGQLRLIETDNLNRHDYERVVKVAHNLKDSCAAIRMAVSAGNVRRAADRLREIISPEHPDMAFLIDKGPVDAGIVKNIQAALQKMLTWMESNFSEETLPKDFQGQGLGIPASAAIISAPAPSPVYETFDKQPVFVPA